ncbi:hypothetical protein FB451DRAFT_1024582 [Mycena latifolia]|nr:hypothetical protein FB451DRAFT_1024582 [Mycena latifolia]
MLPDSVDLTRLLTSNNVPEVSDVPSIFHAISNIHTRIDLLDSHVESVRATLAKLSREREEMDQNIRARKAILSSIRRVPPELLCQIFSDITMEEACKWERRPPTPLRLGHVCAAWRHADITYPTLWKFLNVAHYSESPVTELHPLSVLETTLLRSANSPFM